MSLIITEAQKTMKIAFMGIPSGYNITGVDGCSFGLPSVGIPLATLVANNAQYWFEPDSDGNTALCTTKIIGKSCVARFILGASVITRLGHTFEGLLNGTVNGANYMPPATA